MGMEFELKYRATPPVLEEIRRSIGGTFAQIPMTTSYYDAPERALSARRWTLRCRREGNARICTLKTPGRDGARGEWECPGDDIRIAVEELCQLSGLEELRALTRNGLVQVCGARFVRRCAMISGAGFQAELALDQGSLFAGERQRKFAEAELELKEGSREALIAYAESFAVRFGLEPEPLSKFARAAALEREG